eukprot:2244943-Lingulodinium_polyedra.AAC.1
MSARRRSNASRAAALLKEAVEEVEDTLRLRRGVAENGTEYVRNTIHSGLASYEEATKFLEKRCLAAPRH